ncbi:16S rRNA (cytosine(967)-C(5))-methyltransferase RsmB [Psychrosphaera haliotis]|uniref:16S rRNA (cytosine(967)-C(5))-methyltransferase n=1 Tax=Psychrosphaera haliotis TaxID=555083 RepID=A0A6N8FAT1_9GAMM|nr:16S rRNA (cytosine(967)-C(5))-methyltransferase RsmB [Psychrosphaera haliotis]MUH73563.1 16S rRNA (cytosine(967)-C(5))-methyltransferase RsmB [Psychrosphaera haliotis]
MKVTNVRAAAAETLLAVMDKGVSLSEALPKAQLKIPAKDHALLQEMCFGAIRFFPRFDAITNQLLSKKLKGKQRLFHHLIIIGIYQLEEMRIPQHAAVAETVQAAVSLKAQGLKGLINACLRNFMRNRDNLFSKINNPVTEYSHPSWFIKRVQDAYPDQWQSILTSNLERAPMWLRVHTNNVSTTEFCDALDDAKIEYSQPLADANAILLAAPKPVDKLPGFEQGWFTVQDGAAQHAAHLLSPEDGESVLDACAAPGGKTCHILDLAKCDVTAADIDQTRLDRVTENLERLGETATLIQGDLTIPATLPETQFDRILLDAPCSATGVIRRHPDIKWLRRSEDIDNLAGVQKGILNTLWAKLKPGGIMVYATCSILPSENKDLMKAFLASQADAKLIPINSPISGEESIENPGWQILPGEHNMDGFYYCRIQKQQ